MNPVSNDIDLKSDKPLSQDDLDYISSARAALLQQSPRGAQVLTWSLCLVFSLLLLWSAFANLDEFTRGHGKVVPSSDVQVIQNLEGGILSELLVAEGAEVRRGQVLLRIDDTHFSSAHRESSVRIEQLSIKSKRLQAEATGEEFVADSSGSSVKLQELAVYNSRQMELQGTQQVFTQQIAQKDQEVNELRVKINRLSKSVELLSKEIALTEPLVAEGAISEVEVLRLQRQLNDLSGELNSSKIALKGAVAAAKESKEKLQNIVITFKREAQEELNDVNNDLARLQEQAEALADRVDRTSVISPVNGTVKRLLVKTIGGVIKPGMDIVEVVPSEELLLVEVKVKPSDIAYLHPGQKARIRFTAYDFAVMGGLDGELLQISPDSITDERGDSYYLLKVQTEDNFFSPDGGKLPIIPGMTVSVDILTGSKTLLQYLLKPIFKTKELALRER